MKTDENILLTCDCEDYLYRHDATQEAVDARLDKALAEVEILTCRSETYGSMVFTTLTTGDDGQREHRVELSRGRDGGNRWYCKHVLRVLMARTGASSFVLFDEAEAVRAGVDLGNLRRIDGRLWGIQRNGA